MSKGRKKKPPVVDEAVTNLPTVFQANATPDASLEATSPIWIDRESTSAPTVGEEDDAPSQYARSNAELVDKLLQHRVPLSGRSVAIIIVLAWMGFLSWVFLQDNQAGSLKTAEGFKWFGMKAGLFSLIPLAAIGLIALIAKITAPKKDES